MQAQRLRVQAGQHDCVAFPGQHPAQAQVSMRTFAVSVKACHFSSAKHARLHVEHSS